MLERVIEFEDFRGNKRSETFYFYLNQAEVTLWMTQEGDYTLDKILIRLAQERNGRKIMTMVEDIIHRSFGKISVDGVSFEKNEEDWKRFRGSEAFSNLFMELVTDAKACSEFVQAIIPSDMAEKIKDVMESNMEGLPAEIKDYVPKK